MNLNRIFTSHMVFARNLPVRIYGEGSGRVEISFAGQKKSMVSDSDKWMLEFPPMEYGGPYSMEVAFEGEKIVLEDIYIGEVFLLAGQSNLQFKMSESNTPDEFYESNDKLRLYSTDRIGKTDHFTADDGWVVCEKEQVKYWSAIGFLAGNEISKKKDIAVGIIVCYQGASVIESWVPKGTFEKININIPDDKKFHDHTFEAYSQWNGDGVLYEYGVKQVIPYSLSAVVWYQGESDVSEDEGLVYCDELCELINIWRKDFLNEKLPFVVVQIADYLPRAGMGWSLVQKAQIDVEERLPHVKTVISADVCENDDIHPPTKTKISKRISEAIINDINLW